MSQLINNQLPEVHYGAADSPPPDLRMIKPTIFDLLDNDEELVVTPPDVVALLGFDPKEFSDGR
jgi:hypothetical protein